MNTFAGNFTLEKGSIDTDTVDFDIVHAGDTTYFCMGQIDIATSAELLKYFEEEFWKISAYDLSISTEDEIEVCAEGYDEGMYEMVSFEWKDISFDIISERFDEVEEVCVIREAEESKKYGNKIIKIDFLY